MGILCGIILYPSISETKRHKYTVWALRAAAVPLIVLAFVLTIKNFCELHHTGRTKLGSRADTDDPVSAFPLLEYTTQDAM
jgi:hypothetical protein